MAEQRFPIYLDYAATTPVDPRVAARMADCLTNSGVFANPASSSHVMGREARGMVELARVEVAKLINCKPTEIVWTSGATESDNLAITGVARRFRHQGKHIVTSKTEHKAVLDTCAQLGKEGFEVTLLKPQSNGLISSDQIEAALRPATILVSIMHVNNEIGVIQDIAAIGRICAGRDILFHVDAAQSAGKIAIDMQELDVNLLSLSAHKMYGPKGIGALFISESPRTRVEPLMHGGGHERGIRSGTLATHQIVGMGEACRIARETLTEEAERISALRDRLWDGIAVMGGVHLNGDAEHRVAGVLNVCFEGVEGESLLFALRKLAVSSGSACTSASHEASYVLRALGREDQLAQSSIRFSMGRFTTADDIDTAIAVVTEEVARLRKIAAH